MPHPKNFGRYSKKHFIAEAVKALLNSKSKSVPKRLIGRKIPISSWLEVYQFKINELRLHFNKKVDLATIHFAYNPLVTE